MGIVRQGRQQEINIKKLVKTASKLKAMSHPTRLRIISLLDVDAELCVKDIGAKLKADQATVSLHLKVLKTHSVLKCRKEGKRIYYSLNSENIQNTLAFIDK